MVANFSVRQQKIGEARDLTDHLFFIFTNTLDRKSLTHG
jgi:hypothetical protein